jgi:prepilin-type processing-associated H-X9-DG protein
LHAFHAAAGDPSGQPRVRAFLLSTGELTDVAKRPALYTASPPKAPFTIAASTVKADNKSPGKGLAQDPFAPEIHSLWLEQPDQTLGKRMMLAADADQFTLSPKLDAAAYQNSEGAFVVPLDRVPSTVITAAHERAQISEALNDGKQVALALIRSGNDKGAVFPAAGADLGAELGSYLKDPSILAGNGGFHYTFAGGAFGGIESPSDTPLGYYDGPGGRAYAYADGHVKWVPTP